MYELFTQYALPVIRPIFFIGFLTIAFLALKELVFLYRFHKSIELEDVTEEKQ